MSSHNVLHEIHHAPSMVTDPGDTKVINVDRWSAYIPLISGVAGSTRTLAQPNAVGKRCFLCFDTDGGGDITVSVTGGYNQSGDTSLKFEDAGDFASLESVKVGTTYRWHLAYSSGLPFRLSDPAWDDLRVSVNSVKLAGVRDPEWVSYRDGLVLSFGDEAVNEEIVFFTVQLPHAWKEGTDIEAHVHWVPEDNATGNVRWLLTYSWANIGGAFGASAPLPVNGAAPGVANVHALAELGTIAGAGKTLSSMLVCSLKRESGNAGDTFTGKNAYLLEIDFHYQVDKFGSDNEYGND